MLHSMGESNDENAGLKTSRQGEHKVYVSHNCLKISRISQSHGLNFPIGHVSLSGGN